MAAPPDVPQRWSARRKAEIVVRLLKGESTDALSREAHQTAAKLAEWRDAFLAGAEAGLKGRPEEEEEEAFDEERRRLQAKVGKQASQGLGRVGTPHLVGTVRGDPAAWTGPAGGSFRDPDPGTGWGGHQDGRYPWPPTTNPDKKRWHCDEVAAYDAEIDFLNDQVDSPILTDAQAASIQETVVQKRKAQRRHRILEDELCN